MARRGRIIRRSALFHHSLHIFANSTFVDDEQIEFGIEAAHALNSPILKEEMPPSEYLLEEIEEAANPLFNRKTLAEKGHVALGDVATLLELFEDAKTFGSLIQIPPTLAAKLPEIEQRLNDVLKHGDLTHASAHVIKPLLQQARFLARRYDAVVANPPYMGGKYFAAKLKDFVADQYNPPTWLRITPRQAPFGQFKPMTSTHSRGTLLESYRAAAALADKLEQRGFSVSRIKIEAMPDNLDIPQSDAQATRLPPDNYFEHHLKLLLPAETELESLQALCEASGAHLSANIFKRREDGRAERFVTLRSYQVGRTSADSRMKALERSLAHAGHEITSAICEYCLYDSNVGVDAHWLEP